MLTPEELLKPRYKVVADYPENTFGVGDVIELDYEYDPEGGSYWYHECGFTKSDFEKFPHIFTKLEWWQDRRLEDMPEYLQWESGIKIIKVIRWHLGETGKAWAYHDSKDSWGKWLTNEWTPATEADYINYTKTKHP